MHADNSEKLAVLFKAVPTGNVWSPWSWRQEAVPLPGVAFAFHHEDASDVLRTAYFTRVDATKFHRAIPVDERTQKEWPNKSKDIAGRFSNDAWLLLETVERVASDHLICRVLTRVYSDLADVCVGKSCWNYERSVYLNTLGEKRNGNRVFVSFDGYDLWEVLTLYPPLAEREPIRIEIVRNRGLPVGGVESVLFSTGLSFISDDDARSRWTNHIQLIERDLSADRPRQTISESAVAIDGLVQELGKQSLRAGRPLGDFKTESKFLAATKNERLSAWFGAYGTNIGAAELERLRPLIDKLRHVRNVVEHPEKEAKLLVLPDAYSATTAYAVLREFVRLLQAVHKQDTSCLVPVAVTSTPSESEAGVPPSKQPKKAKRKKPSRHGRQS